MCHAELADPPPPLLFHVPKHPSEEAGTSHQCVAGSKDKSKLLPQLDMGALARVRSTHRVSGQCTQCVIKINFHLRSAVPPEGAHRTHRCSRCRHREHTILEYNFHCRTETGLTSTHL